MACECPERVGLHVDARLHQESGGQKGQTTTPGTLKLSQVTCKLACKELPVHHPVSIKAGKTITPFKLETWKLVHNTSSGTLRATSKELT